MCCVTAQSVKGRDPIKKQRNRKTDFSDFDPDYHSLTVKQGGESTGLDTTVVQLFLSPDKRQHLAQSKNITHFSLISSPLLRRYHICVLL